MIYEIKEYKNKKYITFPFMSKLGLEAAFTTSDMDFRHSDSIDHNLIAENYNLLREVTKGNGKALFSTCQVHKDTIQFITKLEDGNLYRHGREFEDCDGLISARSDIILKTIYADCIPILLFDPILKVQGSLHSGWKGTTLQIGKKGVQMMTKNYGCKTSDIIALIGPAIEKNSFEVENDVLKIFQKTFPYWKNYITKKSKIKYLIDLKGINKEILLSSGLQEKNIYNCNLNTYGNPLFHSHRYNGATSGRMILFSHILTHNIKNNNPLI